MVTLPHSHEVARCTLVASCNFKGCNLSSLTLSSLILYSCTLILKYGIKGYGYIRTHTYTHIYARILYFYFFYLALLKKCKKGCNGATKPLQTYIYAVFSGCTHFIKDATRTKI